MEHIDAVELQAIRQREARDVLELEHRALLARIREHAIAMLAARSGDVLEVLHFLGGYVEVRMRAEEDEMLATGFPDRDEHLREHEGFRRTFGALVTKLARHGEDARVFERDVFGWLETHLHTRDAAFGEFVRTRVGATPSAAWSAIESATQGRGQLGLRAGSTDDL